MPNILIADDNLVIRNFLSEYAKKEGYIVSFAVDGEQCLEKFNQNNFDIILLDVMMPNLDGFEVCRQIRKISSVPIIMVTARGEDFERIMGLDIGADDYIVKPFSPGEVMARVRAILRRMERTSNHILMYDNLRMNIDDFTVQLAGQDVSLTKKEIEILWTLAGNRNKVFTRENLLDSVWGYDYYGDSRTVDSHIKRLRAKLDIFPHCNWQIKTVWGMGYKFEVNNSESQQ